MSDTTPLTPEQVDLLLSADLDGEFEAAASDLDLDATSARALLDADPAAAARRAHLEAARDLLAEPIEIDELLAARLRAKAVKAGAEAAADARHAQRSNRTKMFGIISGVAAALLVLVALGAMLRTTSSDTKASSDSASGAPTRTQAPKTATVDAGAGITDDQQLDLSPSYLSLDSLEADLRRKAAFSAAVGAADTDGYESANQAGSPFAKSAYKCAAAAQKLETEADQPLANGTTKVAGKPLSVLVYGNADGRKVLVFDRDCKLVNQQLIH